ncbi:MAG: cytochrome c family protein [Hyphomicrobium sp.]
MTAEPSELGRTSDSSPRGEAGAAQPDCTLKCKEADRYVSSDASPLRVLLAVVPMVFIIVAVTNLLGLWATSSQQAAREERLKQAEIREMADAVARNTAPQNAAPPSIGLSFPGAGEQGVGDTPELTEKLEPRFDKAAVMALLPTADVYDGASVFRVCSVCHLATKDEAGKLGPNLWGIIGRPKASSPHYMYSQSLKRMGGTWSYEDLAEFIHNPRTFVPGTAMAFRGVSGNAKIANLIAYLRTLSDTPAPLPE